MQPFRLTRHFMLTSFAVFLLFAILLYLLDDLRRDGLHDIQREENTAIAELQAGLVSLAAESVRRDLLVLHEQGNLDTSRLLANLLWDGTLSAYLDEARGLDLADCPRASAPGEPAPPLAHLSCQRRLNRRLTLLPSFAAADARLRDAVHDSRIFRLKLFDLRGLTVYSTDSEQIGEDATDSPGWIAAREGRPWSHLSARGEPHAPRGGPERRDILSAYLPLQAPGSSQPVAVIETYTDATTIVRRLDDAAATQHDNARERGRTMNVRLDHMRQSLDTTGTGLTLAALLLTLMVYLLLLLIVRRASRLVDQQSLQMQHSRAHLVQFDKMVMLGRMVAGVAHQLNTPLAYCRTNLRLLGELLARCTSDRPLREQDRSDARQMLDDTLGGVLMMDELVRHLRGFTRLDQAPTDHVDLNAAIASVVYIARSVVPPHIHIDERYDERLPHLNVHAARLNQAVLNLLMNAAQAIAGTGSVTVSTHRDAHAVRIAVADTGNGIPPSLHERVFEPFFTTKPSGQGTGLGLSVVREIVEQHGGRVDLSSQPGLGTTVTLHLPLPAGAHP